MMRRLAAANVPLLYVVLLLIVAVGGAIFAIARFGDTIYRYQVLLEDKNAATRELRFGSWPALANPDFFREVKEKFIAGKISFIEADLSAMRLTFYREGAPVETFPILTKGREGSWWETPAGLYKIDGKKENHFSAFAGVYLPWSLPFQGNFFIHGWPYYPGGEPVRSTYSGGCIRLSTDDAKKLYDLVTLGTPVLVFEKDFAADNLAYEVRLPEISAKEYLVADLKSNFVLLGKATRESAPIASLTKLVTALAAAEYINLDNTVTITDEMLVPTSKPRLVAGENISAFNLLYPLLLESSNEAAIALAANLGQGRFVALMNDKARSLGMTQTTFVDPSGSGAGNVSTVEDLFALLRSIYNNRSFILQLTTGRLDNSVYGRPAFNDLGNFNVFGNYPEFLGGKMGVSESAGETMATIWNVIISGETRPLAVVVLGSREAAQDTETLVNHVRATYAVRPAEN
ncbi:MAG: L,D-transpeptidase family protein [Patescibacteria group bacterium]